MNARIANAFRCPEALTEADYVELSAAMTKDAVQSELRTIFADITEPQPEGIPAIVGTGPLAPLPKNKKRARYIEVNGVELDALALRGNRK